MTAARAMTPSRAGSSRPDFSVPDDPPAAFIDALRRRFPTEAEVDHMLTTKMRNRSGPPYQRIALEDMRERLTRFLDHHIDGGFEVSEVRWFTGGVSKIQVGFTLEWTDPDVGGPARDRLVLRMDPAEGSNATSRAREFELLRFVADTLPVPRASWLDAEGTWFPRPALIYAFADGVTKPTGTSSGKVSGIGTEFDEELRRGLGHQFVRQLAALHTLDVGAASFSTLQTPRVGSDDAARWLLNQARRTWEEDRGEDLLLMEVAANWLEDHVPTLDHPSIVHGDFRTGNFLFDESTGRISSWLDWERGHVGDRHRDLAWTTQRTFGRLDAQGRLNVCGLIPIEEFYAAYEEHSGLTVDQERLDYFRILNCYSMIVSALASAYRVTRLGKSHQDIVLTRVEGVVPIVTGELRELLSERV